jgi:NitT/TauT family transport system ATP-binding protein
MHDRFAVEIHKVTKRFPAPTGRPESEVVAVDDVTLQIRDGEFSSLLGPSGCGHNQLYLVWQPQQGL